MSDGTSIPVCRECGQAFVFHFLTIEHRRPVMEDYFCEEHSRLLFQQYGPFAERIGSGLREAIDGATRFEMEALLTRNDGRCAVYLREQGGSRQLELETGYVESALLNWVLKGERAPRPSTHELFARTIEELGGTLQRVLIDRFSEDRKILYAYLQMRQHDRLLRVDARPSDALNLAAVCGAPIFVSQKVLENM